MPNTNASNGNPDTVRVHADQLEACKKEDSDRLAAATESSDDELTRCAEADPDSQPITSEDLEFGRVRLSHRRPRPVKTPVTIRLDDDLIEWFKGDDPSGYQTRINEALRSYRARVQSPNDAAEALEQIDALLERVRANVVERWGPPCRRGN